MFGLGIVKGLGVTFKHLLDTYVDNIKQIPSRYATGREFIDQPPDTEGLFTIQYPEEKRQLPERFRYVPMLLFDTQREEDRCTACGICAKVCPPQCIWIVRDKDENGKPVTRPAEFYIDASICMSCGYCAEFCPFDAIKMNHDYEVSVYNRYPDLVHDKAELTVPLEYYIKLYPKQYADEERYREEEEAKKRKAQEARARKSRDGDSGDAKGKPAAQGRLSQEEIQKRREAAMARRAAKEQEDGGDSSQKSAKRDLPEAREARTAPGSKLSPEEIQKRREEALARRAARKKDEDNE